MRAGSRRPNLGAVGALGGLLLALWRRKLDWSGLWRVLTETGQVTVSILFVVIAANIYSRLIALTGMPGLLDSWVTGANLGFFTLLLVYSILIVLMGTMIDAVSIMLIVVPMFLPLVKNFGADLIWFGIVTVVAAEIGLLTPPFGLSVFVIKSTLNDDRLSLNEIFKGALPFAATMFVVLILIILVPRIATVLL